MIQGYLLWVLVFQDGVWRAWEHRYPTESACLEVRAVLVHHRDHILRAECRPSYK